MPVATRRQRERPPITAEAQRVGLRTLERSIPLAEPRRTLPRDEAIARAMARYKALKRPANVYQRSFTAFREHLAFTKDEAAGGVVRRMPNWPYLREMDEAVLTCPRLLIEKSRRVLASWHACCLDIWICAGGQDPRWPSLMRSTRNRQVILAARKLEDIQGSAWFLEERVKFILDEFERRDLRRYWPEFPAWTYRFAHIGFSNGSHIDAVPQGADQIRGAGATLLHFEELSFWEQARPSVNAAIPALAGGGHLLGITTPLAGSYAHSITLGKAGSSGRHR